MPEIVRQVEGESFTAAFPLAEQAEKEFSIHQELKNLVDCGMIPMSQ